MTRRNRQNFLGGTLSTAMPIGDVSMDSLKLADLEAIAAPVIAVVVLDPLSTNGAPEIVHITVHAGAAITATVLRGREGTVERLHPAGTTWKHAPVEMDWSDTAPEYTEAEIAALPSYFPVGGTVTATDGIRGLRTKRPTGFMHAKGRVLDLALDFGMIADATGVSGVGTDNTAAFNAAILVASTQNVELFLPPDGIYRLGSAPNGPASNFKLSGVEGLSKLFMDYGTKTTYGWTIDATAASRNNITIRGIVFFSNNLNVTADKTPASAIRLQNHPTNTLNDITIEHCEFFYFVTDALSGFNGGVPETCQRLRFDHNKNHDNGTLTMARPGGNIYNAGMITPPQCLQPSISFNESWNVGDTDTTRGDHTIYLSGTRQVVDGIIQGNRVYQPTGYTCDGFTIDAGSSVQCFGNAIALVNGDGIVSRDAPGSHIYANKVTALGTTVRAYLSQGSSNVTWDANEFDGGGFSGHTCVQYDGGGAYNRLRGFKAWGLVSNGKGASIAGDFTNGELTGCHFVGASGGGTSNPGIYIEGAVGRTIADDIVGHNIVLGFDVGIRVVGASPNHPRRLLVHNNIVSAATTSLLDETAVVGAVDWSGNHVIKGAVSGVVGGFTTAINASADDLGPRFEGFRALGSYETPTALTNNAHIVSLSAGGYDGTVWATRVARVACFASEAWTATAHGTQWFFQAIPNGTTALTTMMKLLNTGSLDLSDYDTAIRHFKFGTSNGFRFGSAVGEKIAFHGATPVIQRAGAAQAAVVTTAATQTSPWGFATQAQADAIVTLVNELRAASVEKGLIKGAA